MSCALKPGWRIAAQSAAVKRRVVIANDGYDVTWSYQHPATSSVPPTTTGEPSRADDAGHSGDGRTTALTVDSATETT